MWKHVWNCHISGMRELLNAQNWRKHLQQHQYINIFGKDSDTLKRPFGNIWNVQENFSSPGFWQLAIYDLETLLLAGYPCLPREDFASIYGSACLTALPVEWKCQVKIGFHTFQWVDIYIFIYIISSTIVDLLCLLDSFELYYLDLHSGLYAKNKLLPSMP